MDYFFDTNIILNYLRRSKLSEFINNKYEPLEPPNVTLISVVSIGEIKSIATQNNWGVKKWKALNNSKVCDSRYKY